MIHTVTPYPIYKPSGVEWLGDVPEHWYLQRTKTLLNERVEKGYPNEPLLAATQTKGVVKKEEYENRTVLALKDLHQLKLVRIKDFVISLRSFQGGIEYARDQGIISPAYTILFLKKPEMHGYIAILFKSKPYIENLSLYVTGIRQGQNIDYEKLSRSKIPVPPLPEQTAIVRYLDYMDHRIRRFINAKKKLIALLEEEKQAIIHNAVTRGLDPDVRFKPSGVEWLGDVPEHWDILKLKNISKREQNGSTPPSDNPQYYHTHGLPWYGPTSINSSLIIGEPSRFISHLGIKEGKIRPISPPALAVSVIGNVGKCALIIERGATNQQITCFEIKEYYNPKFIALQFTFGKKYLQALASSTTIPILNSYYLRNIKFAIPPLSEQNAIVQNQDVATKTIQSVITHALQEILLLQEYRTRLIADVVTGKIDVREAAANLNEIHEESDLFDEEQTSAEYDEEAIEVDVTSEEEEE